LIESEQLELEKLEGRKGNEAYVKALPPTYLAFDTDGRVIRMDVCRVMI
jgi:aromatic amino acid aminotransferase I